MSENTTNNIALINLPDMPESADNAVKNLTDAPTQNIGKTFADIWYLVFGGISQKAEKKRLQYAHDLEKFREQLDQSIDEIPDDKKLEPSLQTTAQALENSKYCVSSEILREMFTKLISGSMNSDTASLAHPSFPEILKQLSPSDALLLQDLFLSSQSSFPVASMGVKIRGNSYQILYDNVFIHPSISLEREQISLSLDSLKRANLISINYNKQISGDNFYNSLKRTPEYSNVSEFAIDYSVDHPNSTSYFKKGLIQLTSLGKTFCSICIGKH